MTIIEGQRPLDDYRAPSPPPGYIERDRLDPLFQRGRGRLVRVLAPGGYGKTSIASRWVALDARTVRWVDVSRGHNDPVALLDTLRQALSGIVELGWPSALQSGADDPCVAVLRGAFGELHEHGPVEPFVLVLDDVHRLRDRAAAMLVAALAECLPSAATLLLVGRAHHDHGTIGRLRLSPGVVDVTVDDLAFDGIECRRLLGAMGIDTGSPEVARIVSLLDGWPAGLQLVGRVVAGDGTVPPEGDIVDHVALVDYLRAEWTDQLDADDLEFLREAACLTRITGDMCDRVLSRSGSAELLQRLHRDELVVFPLDKRDCWYRLHPLLSRWLAGELREAAPQRWREIHCDASAYWEHAGEIDLAVAHAQRAGDLARCEILVTTHGGTYFTRGRDATVRAWLDAFPADHLRRSVGLCSLNVINALHTGDDARATQWLRLADQVIARPTAGGSNDPMTGWTEILHAAMDRRPASELIPICETGLSHLGGGPWASFGWWTLGALHFLDGDPAMADKALQCGLFEAELAETPLVAAHCLASGAIIDDCCGDHSRAAERGLQAADVLRDCHGEALPPTAPVMAMRALLHARQGERPDAQTHIDAARRALEGFQSVSPWFNVITRIALVRATLLLDDREASRTLLRELELHARFESSTGGAAAPIRELRARVDAMHRPATGASALTDAELAVLRHLPTNLSLAKIADRLFVSRNTVKSHTAAIYRKLGANNRTDAVERARAAGLLDDQQVAPG